MFLRGLDTTGNVDNETNRTLLSFEEGSFIVSKENGDSGALNRMSRFSSWALSMQSVNQDLPVDKTLSVPSGYVPGMNQTAGNPTTNSAYIGVTRPKNIAVNYIIKAKVTENGKDGDYLPINITKDYNITTDGHLNFDTLKINGNISDIPGNTSNSVPTTSWVDKNYASLANLQQVQKSIPANIVTSPSQSSTGYNIDTIGINTGTGQLWVHNSNTGNFLFVQPAGDYAFKNDLNNYLPLSGGNIAGNTTINNMGITYKQKNPDGTTIANTYIGEEGEISAWSTYAQTYITPGHTTYQGYQNDPYPSITFRPFSSETNPSDTVIKGPSSNMLRITVGEASFYFKDDGTAGIGEEGNGQSWLTTNDINNISGLVGVPQPWPTSTPPANYAICDGSTFNTTTYSTLAQLYPSGRLPDLRGMFIRGYDSTGNIDNSSGRQLLSYEEGSRMAASQNGNISNLNNISASNGRFTGAQNLGWDIPSNQNENWPTGFVYSNGQDNATLTQNEILGVSRPKNIAFNYIVRLS